jgi:hypothetical protein
MTVTLAADLANRISADHEFVAGVHDTVFRNTDSLIGRVIPLRGYQAGEQVEVRVITSANSSAEVYTEGASAPDRGKQTVIKTSFAFKHFRIMIGETGHARRKRGPNNEGLADGSSPDFELQFAMEDLRDLMTTTFMTAGQTYSIDGIIDDSGTNFGDQSRSTYTTLVSYKLAASSAGLSTSLLNKANWRSREAPYGAKIDFWLAAPLQVGLYAELVSGKLAVPTAGGTQDIIPDMFNIAGSMFVPQPDLTTSIILGFTGIDRYWGYTSNERGNFAGGGLGFHARLFGSQDDSDTMQISTAGAVWCTAPQKQARIEGLSTG